MLDRQWPGVFGIFHPQVYDRRRESFRTFRCTMPAIYDV